MNERIRELAQQAKKHALDAMIKITDKEQALKAYSETYDKKFAELILEECQLAFWSESCRVSDLAYEEYSSNCRKIQEHFRVNQ